MSAIEQVTSSVAEQIRQLCDQIVSKFRPQKVILFGSHAYGQPSEDSDVDILVVMPFEGSSREQAAIIRGSIDTPVALDLLVRTPEQVSERLAMGDFFMHEIIGHGKVLHEADHP